MTASCASSDDGDSATNFLLPPPPASLPPKGAYATSMGPEPINTDREALYRPRPTVAIPARVLAAAGAMLKVGGEGVCGGE